MGGKARSLWAVAAIVVIIAVAGALLWVVWRSHRSDLTTFGSFAVATAGLAVTLIIYVAHRRRAVGPAGKRALTQLGDLLARAVTDQWARAAMDRRLVYPVPIPVQWERLGQPLAGPVSTPAGPHHFRPLPGLQPYRPHQLPKGGLQDLHAVYGGLESGRLVIVGAPGSGKSGAAVLLVLAALRHREQVSAKDRPLVPVPVMLTLHGWDPSSQRVQEWLAGRLRQTYPLFPGRGGAAAAAALVNAGRLAVILDGLDEIPDELRPDALRALSRQADFRVVVLARSAEMSAAAGQGLLEGAVTLELQDVNPEVAADYLTDVQVQPAPAGWRALADRLRRAPHSSLAQALSSPLALTLVRDTYREGGDVRELLDLCDAGDGSSREDIEDALFDRVLPAAYAPQFGLAPSRYELQVAHRALAYIAARMNQEGTRDLAWWRIPVWSPAVTSRIIATGILVGLLVWLVVGLVVGLAGGLAFGLVGGLAGGLAFGLGGRSPERIARLQWRQLLSPSSLVLALAGGLAGGLGRGLVGALAGGLAGGLVAGLAQPAAGKASPLSPLAAWRASNRFGLVFGITVVFVATVSGWVAGRLILGLAVGLAIGLASVVAYPATWPVSLAFAQIARRRHMPIRVMRFLEDARKRDVLRTIGPVYQFRHARLQDRLAAQPAYVKVVSDAALEPAAATDQPPAVIDETPP